MNYAMNQKPKLSALALAVALASGGAAFAGEPNNEAANADRPGMKSEVKAEAKEAWHETKDAAKSGAAYTESATRNAWLHGKLETTYLLNRHLNNFAINSKVMGHTAILEGKVESDIDRELAEQLALGVNGIDEVTNNLVVDNANARAEMKAERDASGRSFADRVNDATTTASIKTKLLMNSSTGGMAINVDTVDSVVTLRGTVKSSEERVLAGQIATNDEDVRSVRNELEVKADS